MDRSRRLIQRSDRGGVTRQAREQHDARTDRGRRCQHGRSGVTSETLQDAFDGSPLMSPWTDAKLRRVSNDDYSPSSRSAHSLAARPHGLRRWDQRIPRPADTADDWQLAVNDGLGDDDVTVVTRTDRQTIHRANRRRGADPLPHDTPAPTVTTGPSTPSASSASPQLHHKHDRQRVVFLAFAPAPPGRRRAARAGCVASARPRSRLERCNRHPRRCADRRRWRTLLPPLRRWRPRAVDWWALRSPLRVVAVPPSPWTAQLHRSACRCRRSHNRAHLTASPPTCHWPDGRTSIRYCAGSVVAMFSALLARASCSLRPAWLRDRLWRVRGGHHCVSHATDARAPGEASTMHNERCEDFMPAPAWLSESSVLRSWLPPLSWHP